MRQIERQVFAEFSASRDQLAKLGEILVWGFQEGNLKSKEVDRLTIILDTDAQIIVQSNRETICHSVIEGVTR